MTGIPVGLGSIGENELNIEMKSDHYFSSGRHLVQTVSEDFRARIA